MLDVSADTLAKISRDIPKRPAYWAEEIYGMVPTPFQRELIAAPFIRQKSAFGSGHSLGKTESVLVVPGLWLLSHYPGYVLLASADWPHVRDKIFPGIRRKNRMAKLQILDPKKVMKTKWDLGDEWAAIGLSPDNPEGWQGWHTSGGTLVWDDEASDMENTLTQSMMSLIISPRDAIVLTGNPLRNTGIFADILMGEPGYEDWFTSETSSETSPCYIAAKRAIERGILTHEECMEGKEFEVLASELRQWEGLASYRYVETERAKWGEDHPEFQARVLGQVPDVTEETFIPMSTVRKCAKRYQEYEKEFSHEPALSNRCVLGWDPAWTKGGDPSGCTIRDTINDWLPHTQEYRYDEADQAIDEIIRLDKKYKLWRIHVERDATGAEIIIGLRRKGYKNVYPLIAAQSATDKASFANLRAEGWSKMRDGMETLMFHPGVQNLYKQCTRVKVFRDGKHRILLESKKDMKKRGERSPNIADSLYLTYAWPPGEGAFIAAQSSAFRMIDKPRLELIGKDNLLWVDDIEYSLPDGRKNPRPGVLFRSMYFSSRRGATGVIWGHIDDDGCWTITDSYSPLDSITIEELYAECLSDDRIGFEHRYSFDLCSCGKGYQTTDGSSFMDAVHRQVIEQKGNSFPFFVEPTKIDGTSGLEIIDGLLLSTLARFPLDPYWARTGRNPDRYLRPSMIAVWPGDVADELENARLRDRMAAMDEWEDRPEDLVGGGGPYVRCLRLLAVSGARYVTAK